MYFPAPGLKYEDWDEDTCLLQIYGGKYEDWDEDTCLLQIYGGEVPSTQKFKLLQSVLVASETMLKWK